MKNCTISTRAGVFAAIISLFAFNAHAQVKPGDHIAAQNAALVASYLSKHPKIAHVNYLGFLAADDPRKAVFKKQCESAGSTFGFAVKGAEAEATLAQR